jgi:hypothetical protein
VEAEVPRGEGDTGVVHSCNGHRSLRIHGIDVLSKILSHFASI